MAQISNYLLDSITGTAGRRPSGAKLYHRGSRFGDPERRRIPRETAWAIMAAAERLELATRTKGKHGGVLKEKGLAVLRALLRGCYSYKTGECFPSYERIAELAGCCRETVRAKLRLLERLGFLETVRRKLVASFTSRRHRVRFDCAVQTSNSYVFNFPHAERPTQGDLALPLLAGKATETLGFTAGKSAETAGFEPEANFRSGTSWTLKNTMPAELAAALEGLGTFIDAAAKPA